MGPTWERETHLRDLFVILGLWAWLAFLSSWCCFEVLHTVVTTERCRRRYRHIFIFIIITISIYVYIYVLNFLCFYIYIYVYLYVYLYGHRQKTDQGIDPHVDFKIDPGIDVNLAQVQPAQAQAQASLESLICMFA